MKTRRQARQEAGDRISSTASSSPFHAGRPRKRKCRREIKSHSRDMPSFMWKREDEELLLEACKQEHIACLVGRRPKKNLNAIIAAYMNEKNENREGLNLKPKQIKNKLETFEKLWKAYHLPKKGRRYDFRIIAENLEQFTKLFGTVSPSDSLLTSTMKRSSEVHMQQNNSEVSLNHAPTSQVPTIQEVFNLMKECGATEDTPLFYTATELVVKPEYRQLFMVIETQEKRLDWLKYKHEKMNS